MGLAPLPPSKNGYVEQEAYYKLQKEFRQKEQDYLTQIALKDQKIELLKIQIKETEEREQQQKTLYEKMFSALEQGNTNEIKTLSATRGKKPEEFFNSTTMSFGKEIENMQKQLQDEMQQRIKELEATLKQTNHLLNEQKMTFNMKKESLSAEISQVTNEKNDMKL